MKSLQLWDTQTCFEPWLVHDSGQVFKLPILQFLENGINDAGNEPVIMKHWFYLFQKVVKELIH